MSFGQLIIGAPGSGKTTYCFAVKEYLEYFGRSTIIINLDPANETPLYKVTKFLFSLTSTFEN